MLNNLEQHAVELFLLNEVYKHNDAMTCTQASSQTDAKEAIIVSLVDMFPLEHSPFDKIGLRAFQVSD